ncbi:hypothetical protein CSA37_05035 [Candidatus Fermentibacteria bacterium]|nr:MAG: hypothetical protein CSA37_10325 [Candidatus Fermentibacteria bacterium]PIE52293.1 MAG: hypothetical protein CSA37_07430 [Candidatus Fermentibacteria bacterium]PIE52788.1 MAG: hypothetical protein CSA37_05035 [Candidatus Fermentibacteria bacterium]
MVLRQSGISGQGRGFLMKFSVVIPSRNGLSILRRFLPGIISETEQAGGLVIVVDDCSSDGTSAAVEKEFPSVRILERKGSPAFCSAVNLGMSNAEGDYLMLLNNDTSPEPGSFSMLLKRLQESEREVAAAVPSIPRPDGTDDSLFRWGFRRGLAVTMQGGSGEPYPSGACALWKRKAWEALNGLDTRFAPIYWEDTDLGARMTGAGYRMIIVEEAVVNHLHRATMGSSQATMALRERNRFVFMEIHCSSLLMRISTALWLPLHFIKGGSAFREGFRNYLKWRRGRVEV